MLLRNKKPIIRMQYPYDCTNKNPLFDGRFHQIVPIRLRRIVLQGREFFVMDYRDNVINGEATTLITRINGSFVKVPLSDYNYLFEYLYTHTVEEVNINNVKFPEEICLAETINSEVLFGPLESIKDSNLVDVDKMPLYPSNNNLLSGSVPPNPPKPFVYHNNQSDYNYDYDNHDDSKGKHNIYDSNVLHIEEYVPVIVDDSPIPLPISAIEPVSVFTGVPRTEENYEDNSYIYVKSPNFLEHDRHIHRFINRSSDEPYQIRDSKSDESFTIDVQEGTTATVSYIVNGRERRMDVLLIPGKRQYNVHYIEASSKEDYYDSRNSTAIRIIDQYPTYFSNIDEFYRVFTDEFDRRSPMTFTLKDGREISNRSRSR